MAPVRLLPGRRGGDPRPMTTALRSTLFGFLRGSWLRQGAWSVLDQALFAGANFLVNVLLARWLTPEAYGAFTVAFVVFLLAGTVHNGLLIEPMLVFGPGRFEGKTRAYLRTLLRAHAAYALAAGAVLAAVAGVAWAVGAPAFGVLFLTLAVAQGAILALWLLRRACYVVSRPEWAASAGALYLVLLVGGAFALSSADALTGASAFGLMAVTSLVAAAVLALRLGVPVRGHDAALTADVRSAHVGYGRWAASTGVLEWVQLAVPFLALPLFVGLGGSGTLRALFNLAMPAMQGFGALATLCLPLFVRARADGTFGRTFRSVSLGFVGLGVAYGVLVLAFGAAAVEWLYGGTYTATPAALVCLAAIPVAVAVANMLTTAVRSAERPSAVFRARVWAVGVTSTVVLGLTAVFGVVGALAGEVVMLLTEIVALARPVREAARDNGRGGRPAPAPPPAPAAPPVERLRVLVSAFSCGPGGGSEPGLGWHAVREMARHHDVTVLTYEGMRAGIEASLADRPVEGLAFAYYALPFEPARYRTGAESMRGVREQLHYAAWQIAAARVARRLHRERPFDLAHHLTFVKYWAPSAVSGLGIPFVWGPVGGGEATPAAFVAALGAEGARYERQRALAQRLSERLTAVRRTARRAALAFATTEDTRRRMEALGARGVEVRSAIGLPWAEIDRLGALPLPGDGPVRFACVGRQIAWKGYRFAVEAFAAAAETGDPAFHEAELWLIGEGPEHDRLRALASSLGVADRVRFLGQLPRDEVLARLAEVHALVQPSLHDSGGSVCLEALAAGRPVVGFALGGTVVHAPPAAARLVPAPDPETAVAALADAMREVASDPEARRRMGLAGRRIVAEEFAWDVRIADLAERYWEVSGRSRAVPRPAVLPEPEVAWI